ncbi:lactonase family protein [Nocardia sp. AB354]|uniref:lactonase family protein n=1 Tax=Nocardia sp. AB354 TaxID=3413283 RepID=UPI003C1BF1BE
MTTDSTVTGHEGMRVVGANTGTVRTGRTGWGMAIAATVVLGFAAAAQPAVAAPAASDAGYHIYAHGFMSDGIVGFSASDTGQPIPIPGRAATGMPNWAQAPSPDGRFFYAAPTTDPRLISYTIGPDGGQSPLATMPLPDTPVDIVFAPNGRDGFVTVGAMNAAIVPIRIGKDGVAVRNGSPVPVGGAIDGLGSAAVSPDGRNLYVASVTGRQLVVFDIRADGTLSKAKQRLAGGINPLYPAITADGRHLFITNELSATVQAFNRAEDGTLSEVAGSPYPAGLLPHIASTTPDGRYLYVPNMGSSFISSYAIQPDGTLHRLPDVDFAPEPGVNSESSVMSPSGKALWVLGTDPVRAGEEVLRRFAIGDDGTLVRDDSAARYTGTTVADGRTLTLVPAV